MSNMTRLNAKWRYLLSLVVFLSLPAIAQDPKPGDPGYVISPAAVQTSGHLGSSPFDPPDTNDQVFVVDQDSGLDTGCTFRSGGPLVFNIKVNRVVGDVDLLKSKSMISKEAVLRMPAFDVDFDANITNPERDRVFFNGHQVSTEFLTGADGVWKLNAFNVPIEWVNFPSDPGPGGKAVAKDNIVRIDIDVANSDEKWCTAIDWASLSIEVARPIVMAHGILSSGSVWNNIWVSELNSLGLPNSNQLNMGDLDGIASNAGKIATEVAGSKQRWGVDKVVMVAHSKGGLDSRHFVENSDDAEQVIQIGTPNGGSPLADVAQMGAVSLVGPLATVVINALAGPAGVQLTTPYMAGYNLFHGANPDVRYTILAGDYDPDCFILNPFCRPVERALMAITGSGDTIVPLWSAYALSYTGKRIFSTSGGDKKSIHTGLPQSKRVFDKLSDRVKAFGSISTSSVRQPLIPFETGASVVGFIQEGQTKNHPLPIDEQIQVFIPLLYPSGDLDLVLVSPSGQVIDPAFANANPGMSHDDGDILGGLMEVYNLEQPEVGIWTVRVTAPSVIEPSGEVGYSVASWLEKPSITFKGELAEAAISAGAPLTLLGTILEDGVPLSGATVKATIAFPNDSRQTVVLLDDGVGEDDTAGDGVYTGVLTATTAAGNYRIAFSAERSSSPAGPDFSRGDFALATVSRSSSSFVGTFRDFGVDTNGDSLFEELVIEVDLDITDDATYRVFAELEDTAGNILPANIVSTLAAGVTTVELSFDGEAISQNGVDGPYSLRVIRMAEEDGLAIQLVDEIINAYQTTAYSYLEFQHAPIILTGNGSSAGRDTDGNGKFDFLDVNIEVFVDFAGFYNWSARLVDSDSNELSFSANAGFFNAGLNSFNLSFDGELIGAAAIDGPYVVTDLLASGAGRSLVAARALVTDAFLASDFDGFVSDTTPPTLEVILTPSLLWPADHRLVQVDAEIMVQDDIDPAPKVTLVSIESNEPDNGQGDGNTENDIQEAQFGINDRQFKLRAERSGNGDGDGRIYTVTFQAVDNAGNVATTSATVIVPHDMD